ncbi:BMC domain-containing protein [Haliangium ochraceum]|uniref:Bacterial microcompartment protein trimer-1 n=1 Tax=Haliangium ochraceum (strain DSM 14365 / JCM 11303 / SMP-2) TaxID=502025 RepID=BMCT1_HALO1|nr:BMC domain-containing protein [Haliangium ochraceum]D0LHE3.1 RecName: Full=Bacterial microcompartment protein trimer-1; Short=BMC-T1; Short=BMC-T1(S) [Haliangium ochraceum DSM 14365]5DIH_A Chain A, Microcompartments protein [Haliangium ochraceum DSM 14365]5DIH_B Chain B, Microcompartments protein [Haliangium ochraceum DSM 14365]5DIH_C Chain C, Microcompartments protein [Haliangium ochraceum DSM 14365]5DIH_D Chain D, Microcompartments protein [Haliangium ochraceum DSM 14365]5DIH_E Chain E, 
MDHAPERFDATPPAGEPDRPALGVLELTSIARGITVADAALKRAPSLLLMSRPVSSGKHLLMMRGQVAEVEESMIAAREIAGAGSGALLDELELPYAHEQLWRFLDAPVVADAWEEDTESVIIVETATVCAAIDSADAALKTAPVVLRDMRLAIGIAGKAFFTLTGELADVEAAAEVVRERCGARLLELACIARPVDELRGRLFF